MMLLLLSVIFVTIFFVTAKNRDENRRKNVDTENQWHDCFMKIHHEFSSRYDVIRQEWTRQRFQSCLQHVILYVRSQRHHRQQLYNCLESAEFQNKWMKITMNGDGHFSIGGRVWSRAIIQKQNLHSEMHYRWNERRRIMHHLRNHVHQQWMMDYVPRIMMRSHMRQHVLPQLQNVITIKNLNKTQIRTMTHFSDCCLPLIEHAAESMKKRRQNRLFVDALHVHVIHGLDCVLIMWWCTIILLSTILSTKIQWLHHEQKKIFAFHNHCNVKKNTRRQLKKYWKLKKYWNIQRQYQLKTSKTVRSSS